MPTAIIGAGVSLVGGMMSSNAQKKAAKLASQQAEFNPFNVQGAGGTVGFDGQNVNVQADQTTQMFQQGFADQFNTINSGQAGNQGAINFGNQVGNNMGGFFDQANAMSDPSGATGAAGMFGNFSAQNAQFGQQQGIASMAMGNNFGQMQGGRNEAQAQGMFGMANQAFGQTDQSSLAASQLSRMRAQARPGEDRAVNSKFQNLFSKGILSSTAGQRQIGDLALAQEGADIQRSFAADQFANQIGQQNRMFGMNAMQQGMGFRNQDDQFNAQRMNFFGNQGMNQMNFGQNAGMQGMNSAFMANNLVNSRGQQRLQNASSMFQQGQNAQTFNFNQMMGANSANSGINADMRNLIALGGNLGSSGAAAGANQGAFTMAGAGSPGGSFLEGIGGGMMTGAFS